MRISPIDIQQQQFERGFFGYRIGEVREFLQLTSDQLAELGRENSELRGEVRRCRSELKDHREREETLREAMLTAQRAIDEMREQAKREAQLVVAEAEVRAERIVGEAHIGVNRLIKEVQDLRAQRVRILEELRCVLRTHQELLSIHDEHTVAAGAPIAVLEPKVRGPQAAARAG